jgi:hypothetical protein
VPLDTPQAQVVELAEQGFYEVREADRQAAVVAVAAANVELAESERVFVDPRDVVAAVTGNASGTASASAATVLPDEAQERAQRIWWYLLFAGILLLTGESVLAGRLSRAT